MNLRSKCSMLSIWVVFSTFALVSFAACKQTDVGIRCEIGTEAQGESGLVVNLKALDCESRICIFQGTSADTQNPPIPRCSQSCSQDKDCPKDARNCNSGFICRIPKTTGDAKCCKMCVCADDLPFEQRTADANEGTCNVIKQQELQADPDFNFVCPPQ